MHLLTFCESFKYELFQLYCRFAIYRNRNLKNQLCLEFNGYVSFTSHRIFKAATKHFNEDLKELEYFKIPLYKLILLHEILINVPSSKSQSLSFRSDC